MNANVKCRERIRCAHTKKALDLKTSVQRSPAAIFFVLEILAKKTPTVIFLSLLLQKSQTVFFLSSNRLVVHRCLSHHGFKVKILLILLDHSMKINPLICAIFHNEFSKIVLKLIN